MMQTDKLPERIELPCESIFNGEYFAGYWRYVRGTVEALGAQVDLVFREDLKRTGWSSFETRVDGEVVVIDYSDFLIVDTTSSAYDHWLRFHHTPAFLPYPKLGSFPPWSFLDWDEYDRLTSTSRYEASGDSIIYRHSALDARPQNLIQRRTLAHDLLKAHYPEQLQSGFLPQSSYFAECLDSLVVVHIPGSHPHIMDRTVQQMLGLGVCVISPDLWTTCLEKRPQAGVHYVCIQDDYSDLPAKVQWVLENRSEAAKIGQSAKEFFVQHCTPTAIWQYIHKRVSHRRLESAG